MQGNGYAASGARQAIQGDPFARIRRAAGEGLTFRPLGRSHAALFRDGSRTLLVSFESLDDIARLDDDGLPLGLRIAQDRGYAHLGIIAASQSWYRLRALYDLFDRLDDADWFGRFDRVVFHGAGMSGYAAAAYSVVAPGAHVIAIQPQATLDPRVAGWDPRFIEMRRTSFTDRYGYAPRMIDAAASVHILFDPEQNLDFMHAALFVRPNARLLQCRNLGRRIAPALHRMGILRPLIEAACDDRLDEALFWRLYRARRGYLPYLESLAQKLRHEGRPYLGALLCRNVESRFDAPEFRALRAEFEGQLSAVGRPFPSAPGS